MLGLCSCEANFTWSIRLLATSASWATRGARRCTLTIFSRPVAASFAARCSEARDELSTCSRRTNFPNFSLFAVTDAVPSSVGISKRGESTTALAGPSNLAQRFAKCRLLHEPRTKGHVLDERPLHQPARDEWVSGNDPRHASCSLPGQEV